MNENAKIIFASCLLQKIFLPAGVAPYILCLNIVKQLFDILNVIGKNNIFSNRCIEALFKTIKQIPEYSSWKLWRMNLSDRNICISFGIRIYVFFSIYGSSYIIQFTSSLIHIGSLNKK